MKLLVICQYYYPEPFRVTDLCEALARRGHEVTVVTGTPNYPEGKVYPGYEGGKRRDEVRNGVRIHRCRTVPRGTGALRLAVNYFSFPLVSGCYVRSRRCASKNGDAFDAVLVNQLSPVMMAWTGIAYQKKHRVPLILYCLDLWPESLTTGGIRRNSPVYRVFHRISGNIYKQMDKILVTSRQFTRYLKEEFGVPEEGIAYLPQYAEGLFEPLPYKDTGSFDFVFAGNIGALQSVDTILQAAALLRSEPMQFHIVGGGSELERLKTMAQKLGLDNVTFYGRRPVEEMPKYYAMADAMLVTMKANPVLSLTLPGKVQSYMAAGKPVIGAIGGETAEVIRAARCGYCAPAEDAEALAQKLRRFTAADRRAMCVHARNYYEAHFARERFMERLEKTLAAV